MNKQIRDGLIDYLTVMQYAGLTDVGNFPVEIADKLPSVDEQAVSVTKNEAAEIQTAPTLPASIEEPDKSHNEIEPTTTNFTNITVMESEIKNVCVENNSTEDRGDDKLSQLKLLSAEVAACSRCPQLAQSRTQTVFGTGDPYSRLLFLGEAPGADEDIQGEPFVGRSGKLLDDIITKGMKIKREDVYICNILRCRPPGNRTPEPDEAANCSPFLEKTIEIVNPKFICCLGSVATRYLLKTDKSIGQMRKSVHNYNGIKVICTYHPSYLLRMPAAKKDTWEDIKLLMKAMEEY
ncbi:MAG: uracil-DNA glycosylase [Planctomycetaceae bacterium]|jgi:uracil-DNA glycosylase family 4|nr:uracil-DNA glycosylase [Planctomycetaceae bacterium]